TIVLDNGKSTPMHVTLNEQHEIEIAPNTHKVISVGPGKHKFEITCDGESVFSGTKEVAASSWFGKQYSYLFNPDFTNRYATFDVEYGTGLTHLIEDTVEKRRAESGEELNVAAEFKKLRRDVEALPMSPWFELPGGIHYYFSEPPDEVMTRNMVETRTVLVRAARPDHAAIRAAASNENPTEEDFDNLCDVVARLWYYPTRPTSMEIEEGDDETY
ncbi:MAG: hypothetical protein KDB27_14385, partial [Planctomycetales bacterium]|nr:hypothetical protein [Planctomycetales bacterium]